MSEHHRPGKPARVGSSLWLGDIRRLLRANLEGVDGTVWLVTITAPGQDRLPCSTVTCATKGEHRQRAADGCRVDERAAVLWNRTAQKRWSELGRRAVQHTRRAGHRSPVLAGVWQLQRRGVLHKHLVLAYGTLAERRSAQEYVTYLRGHCARWGFGYVDARNRGNGSTVMHARAAANYLTADLTDERAQLLRAAQRADRPRRLVYVRPELMTASRCTMRRLRRVRQLWAYLEHRAARFVWMTDPVESLRVAFLLNGSVPARAP